MYCAIYHHYCGYLSADTIIVINVDRAMASGLQVQVHMDTGQIKSAILTNSPRHSQSHLAQLAFHHLDRILGVGTAVY